MYAEEFNDAFQATFDYFFDFFKKFFYALYNDEFVLIIVVVSVAAPFAYKLLEYIFDVAYNFRDGTDLSPLIHKSKKRGEHEKETRKDMKKKDNKTRETYIISGNDIFLKKQ